MSEQRVWYFYNGKDQVGPIFESELLQYIASGHIRKVDYIFRDGFDDWKLFGELKDLQAKAEKYSASSPAQKRQVPRAAIEELVVAHNGVAVATGVLRDISTSGAFFQTHEDRFKVNEEIKMTLKEGKGLGKPLNFRCVVVRHAGESGGTKGYGLEFIDVDGRVQKCIADYVERHSKAS